MNPPHGPSDPALETEPVVAAIDNDGAGRVDALLAEFAARQRRAGRVVLGLLMDRVDDGSGASPAMVLSDIDSGDGYRVSQALGPGSTGCRADPQGFAAASHVLREALDRRPDLVICNRFGTLEAAGGGFAAELLQLLAQGIPVLTVVSARHRPAWLRFVGEATSLPAAPAAWDAWLDAVLARPGPPEPG